MCAHRFGLVLVQLLLLCRRLGRSRHRGVQRLGLGQPLVLGNPSAIWRAAMAAHQPRTARLACDDGPASLAGANLCCPLKSGFAQPVASGPPILLLIMQLQAAARVSVWTRQVPAVRTHPQPRCRRQLRTQALLGKLFGGDKDQQQVSCRTAA